MYQEIMKFLSAVSALMFGLTIVVAVMRGSPISSEPFPLLIGMLSAAALGFQVRCLFGPRGRWLTPAWIVPCVLAIVLSKYFVRKPPDPSVLAWTLGFTGGLAALCCWHPLKPVIALCRMNIAKHASLPT